ncbi:class I SAM-dependent methyltransferase [Streptomyces sp. NBC_00249]|uniref:class I SAM-dependent methyltransferase n=1 Tax=Streptomyces sp. NBC_00249 TaxID=2975690 RepID=UPI00224F2143|nr:class I SAM-dependent methyltransferase [Streptomyces sp. NBC_00249]MCX5195073.1 class I SAM-dependent methyltransferase [Streptomyces sp. NBC_00249]
MKTSSLWGKPQSRYYSYLARIEAAEAAKAPTLAVIGCADGKYVLPAARKGFEVWAVDVDDIAVNGGVKQDASGEVQVPGLVSRVKQEDLSDRVEVTCGDFMDFPRPGQFDAVFTSGALQYSFNSRHRLAGMVDAVCDLVRVGGLVYFDYMLPLEKKYKGRENCPEAQWWKDHFAGRSDFQVLHHRVLPPVLDKAHIEFPVDHYHQWGHLLVRRAE